MPTNVNIRQAETESDIQNARRLFREYEEWLGLDLCFQGFEDELRTLPGNYSPLTGRLYLAFVDDIPVGCIAMRKLKEGVCEMKRLYLRPEARGLGLGKMLIQKLITEAREIGYTRVFLDTHPPKMGKAVSLYKSYGFTPTAPYYDNPHEDVLFMELRL